MCASHHICATHPKDAPTIGQLGRALQTACLWALPRVVRGRLGWCLAAHLVSGAAICPGCAFAPVPAGSALPHTHPCAPVSHLLGSKRLPCPSMAKTLSPPSATPCSTPGMLWVGECPWLCPREEDFLQELVEPAVPSKASLTSSRPAQWVWRGEERLAGFPTARWQHRDVPVASFPFPGSMHASTGQGEQRGQVGSLVPFFRNLVWVGPCRDSWELVGGMCPRSLPLPLGAYGM